jgi:ribonuclease D
MGHGGGRGWVEFRLGTLRFEAGNGRPLLVGDGMAAHTKGCQFNAAQGFDIAAGAFREGSVVVMARFADRGTELVGAAGNLHQLKVLAFGQGQPPDLHFHNGCGEGPMALGQGEQIGYSNLVDLWMGIQLDKGARFTDWSRRPLDKRQIDYAIADVTHLSAIFPMMLEKLKVTGRGAWLNDEMERISDAANYRNDPENAWSRIKVQSRKPDVLGRLQAMAAWREKEAQRKNIPRGRIMKDETLADIAAHPPKSQADLPKVRGLSPAWRDNDIGARLIAVIEASQPMARDDMPDRGRSSPGGGKDGSLVADLLKLLLKIRSREINVAPRLIVRTEELERLAAGEREDLEVLTGWRFEQFGRDALDLVEGRLAFAVVNGKLKMTHTQEEEMVR